MSRATEVTVPQKLEGAINQDASVSVSVMSKNQTVQGHDDRDLLHQESMIAITQAQLSEQGSPIKLSHHTQGKVSGPDSALKSQQVPDMQTEPSRKELFNEESGILQRASM